MPVQLATAAVVGLLAVRCVRQIPGLALEAFALPALLVMFLML